MSGENDQKEKEKEGVVLEDENGEECGILILRGFAKEYPKEDKMLKRCLIVGGTD